MPIPPSPGCFLSESDGFTPMDTACGHHRGEWTCYISTQFSAHIPRVLCSFTSLVKWLQKAVTRWGTPWAHMSEVRCSSLLPFSIIPGKLFPPFSRIFSLPGHFVLSFTQYKCQFQPHQRITGFRQQPYRQFLHWIKVKRKRARLSPKVCTCGQLFSRVWLFVTPWL